MDFLWFDLLALLLLLPVLVGAYVWSLGRRRPEGVRYSSLSLVRDAVRGSSRLRRHLPLAERSRVLERLGLAARGYAVNAFSNTYRFGIMDRANYLFDFWYCIRHHAEFVQTKPNKQNSR